jgi:preprotein translocase subunit Sss1
MPSTSIVSGVLLILIGIIGYVFSLIDGHTSLTALIPAAFGLLLVIFGFAAKSKENLRKHLMHAAVLVGLLGFLIPAWRLISRMNDLTVSLAVLSQAAMALICLVFVILCVNSFIAVRQNR